MSEHQCYKFVALDRLLRSKEMAELRAISTRGEMRKRQLRRRGFFDRWKRESEPRKW